MTAAKNDMLGVAIQYNDKFDIPWLTQAIGTGKFTDFSLTYYIEHILIWMKTLLSTSRQSSQRRSLYPDRFLFYKAGNVQHLLGFCLQRQL